MRKSLKAVIIFMLTAVMMLSGVFTAYAAETPETPPTDVSAPAPETPIPTDILTPEPAAPTPEAPFPAETPTPTIEPPIETPTPETPPPVETPITTPGAPIQTETPITETPAPIETPMPTPVPTAIPTAEPNPEVPGKLLAFVLDKDTGEKISGAVFSLHRTFDDTAIAELITNGYGEVSYELPAGEYYLRCLAVPDGYILNTNRSGAKIKSGAVTEITVKVTREPVVTPPSAPEPGKLNVYKIAEGTGERLAGAVFGLYDPMSDAELAKLYTNSYGEASYMLPVGDYYLRELSAPSGFTLNTDKIGVKIKPGAVTDVTVANKAIPAQTPPPAPAPGKLLVLTKAKITGEYLSGAAYGLYNAFSDVKLAEMYSDRYGEAGIELTNGDYYLRQLSAPLGYSLNTEKIGVKITSGGIREITVFNEAIPAEKPKPSETPKPAEKPGKLTVTAQVKGTGEKIADAAYGIYNAFSDVKLAEMYSNRYGEAGIELTVGDYYVRQLSVPDGYKLNTDKVSVKIKSGEIKDITFINEPIPAPTPEPTPAPVTTPAEQPGRLLITAKADGEKLSGVVITVYDTMTDVMVIRLITDVYGEISIPLPAGEYYLRQVEVPAGYKLNTDRIGVSMKGGALKEIPVAVEKIPVPTPEPTPKPASTPKPAAKPAASTPKPAAQGNLQITVQAEQSGNPLSGAVFGVFRVSDNAKITELTTGADGNASYALEPADYYLRELKSPYGYLNESARIRFTVSNGTSVKVEVTNQRDGNIPDNEINNIFIPKTGQGFPLANYVSGAALMAAALLCGLLLFGRKMRIRGGY